MRLAERGRAICLFTVASLSYLATVLQFVSLFELIGIRVWRERAKQAVCFVVNACRKEQAVVRSGRAALRQI